MIKCEYNFEDKIWENVSPNAKDFISKLINKNKWKRMTCCESLNHQWMTEFKEITSIKCLDDNFYSLNKYQQTLKSINEKEQIYSENNIIWS